MNQEVKNAPVKSANQIKIEAKILLYEQLKKQRPLSTNELKLFANAKAKIENRSASKIFKDVQELKDYKELLGTSKEPTFKEFCAKLPNKSLFSLWDGLTAIVKFNKLAVQSAKVAKQGGEIGAKAKAQTTKANEARATKAVAKVVNEVLSGVPA